MLQEGAPLLLCLTQWEEKGLRLREGVGLTTQPCHAQMGGFLSSFSLLNTVSYSRPCSSISMGSSCVSAPAWSRFSATWPASWSCPTSTPATERWARVLRLLCFPRAPLIIPRVLWLSVHGTLASLPPVQPSGGSLDRRTGPRELDKDLPCHL